MSRVVVDTGVFIDYIDRLSPFHEPAKAIIDALGQLKILLPSITLTEICYVTARILDAAGVSDHFKRAVEFVEWLNTHPSVQVVDDIQLRIQTAELKLKYGMALADCYVLALANREGCSAIFRKREREMPKKILKMFDLVFLEDYVGRTRGGKKQ